MNYQGIFGEFPKTGPENEMISLRQIWSLVPPVGQSSQVPCSVAVLCRLERKWEGLLCLSQSVPKEKNQGFFQLPVRQRVLFQGRPVLELQPVVMAVQPCFLSCLLDHEATLSFFLVRSSFITFVSWCSTVRLWSHCYNPIGKFMLGWVETRSGYNFPHFPPREVGYVWGGDNRAELSLCD